MLITHAIEKVAHKSSPHEKGFFGKTESLALNAPFVGLELGLAKRGERLAAATGSAVDMGTYPMWEAGLAAVISLIPGMAPFAPYIAMGLAMIPSSLTGKSISYTVRSITKHAKQVNRLQIGGKYIDTSVALNIRRNAMAELTYAAVPARRLLGQEAMFLHR